MLPFLECEKITDEDGVKCRHRAEVYAIDDKGNILVHTNEYESFLELPGGGMDEGETTTAAARREMAEESGWDAHIFTQLELKDNWTFDAKITTIKDDWHLRQGWQKEKYYAVLAQKPYFRPTQLYGAEGDANVYVMMPIQKAYDILVSYVDGLTCPRQEHKYRFRIKVLEVMRKLGLW